MFGRLVVVGLFAFFGASAGVPVGMAIKAVRTSVSVINDITTLVLGVDGMLSMFMGEEDDSAEVFQSTVMQKLDEIYAVCGKFDELKTQMNEMSFALQLSTATIVASVEFNRAKEIVAHFKKNIDYVNNVYKNRFAAAWEAARAAGGGLGAYLRGLVCDYGFDRALSEILSDVTSSLKSQSSIFTAVAQYYNPQNGYEFQCESITRMDDIHIFYAHVVTSMARGYAVLSMSQHKLQMTSDPEDREFYRIQQNLTLANFKEAIESINRHAQIDFASLPSDYRGSFACDPPEWREGENFIRVKNYISQQTGEVELDESKYPSAEEIAKSKEYDCDDVAEYVGGPRSPVGTTSFVCFDPFDPAKADPSAEYQELMSPHDRIWESRHCVDKDINERNTRCEKDRSSDPFLSIRKLSLRLQECDVGKNEVVTGARFHEHDNVIHIKLRCGVLVDGAVDPDTQRWTDDVRGLADHERAVLQTNLKAFNMDNVLVRNGEILTGAGFEVINGTYISLVVKGHKVNNYSSGTTFGEGNTYSAPKSKKPRRNIDITGFKRPLKQMSQTYERSKAGETYVSLTVSKFSSEYHNKAIVPYFDMTPFGPDHTAVPLGGLGLFYKSDGERAGFFAFKHLSLIHVFYSALEPALEA